MPGSAARKRSFVSVKRNSRNAVCCTSAFARAGSVSPGISTISRQFPTTWTTGSVVPNSFDAGTHHAFSTQNRVATIRNFPTPFIHLELEVDAAPQVETKANRNATYGGISRLTANRVPHTLLRVTRQDRNSCCDQDQNGPDSPF